MNNMSLPPAVPSIHIHTEEDNSALFPTLESEWLECNMYRSTQDSNMYTYPSATFQPEYNSSRLTELEEMDEFSHLATTNQLFMTGPGYTLPQAIMQDMSTVESSLSPSFASSTPSPTSSFGGSLSPSSFYDHPVFSDSESPLSPSPATPEGFSWPHRMSVPIIASLSTESLNAPTSLGPQSGPLRPRSHSSSSSRQGPVASKAMLEANSRRRRHPAQFECEDCNQTFTALFSLKRHRQSHTGERPFACSIPGCNQRFFNSSDCKRHEKSKKRHKELMQ